MSLPKVPSRTVEVIIADEKVVCHSLTRAEVSQVHKAWEDGNPIEAEVLMIAFGTNTPVEEAREWINTAPFDVVNLLSKAITEVSGLAEDTAKK